MALPINKFVVGQRIICVIPGHTCNGKTGTISYIHSKKYFRYNGIDFYDYDVKWDDGSHYMESGWARLDSFDEYNGGVYTIPFNMDSEVPSISFDEVKNRRFTGLVKPIDKPCQVCQKPCTITDKKCWWCENRPFN